LKTAQDAVQQAQALALAKARVVAQRCPARIVLAA